MASATAANVPKKAALAIPGAISPREKLPKSPRDGKKSPRDGGKSPRGKLPSALLVEDPSANAKAGDANVGDKVLVGKFQLGKLLPKGIVRFRGDTMFADGEWFGIELNEKEGKNDGSVAGVRYFTCKKFHGIFVRGTLVTKDTGSRSASPRPSPRPAPKDADSPVPPLQLKTGRERAKSMFEEVTLESGSKVEVVKGKFVGKVGKAYGVQHATGEIRVVLDTGNGLVIVRPHDCSALQEEASPLDVGNQVEFLGLNATIRYKGHLKTGTSDDVWVGMELKKPLGRSNGNFRGHQYFECKDGHALFAQAVTGAPTVEKPIVKSKRSRSRTSLSIRRTSSLRGDDAILVEDQVDFVLQGEALKHAVTSDKELTEELEKKTQETLELQKKLQQLTDQEEEYRNKVREGRAKQKAMLGQLYALPQEALKAFNKDEESVDDSEGSADEGSESADSQASDDSEILDLSQFVDYDSW